MIQASACMRLAPWYWYLNLAFTTETLVAYIAICSRPDVTYTGAKSCQSRKDLILRVVNTP